MNIKQVIINICFIAKNLLGILRLSREKQVAKLYNISRSYVSRIEKRALTKLLREFIKNKNHTE